MKFHRLLLLVPLSVFLMGVDACPDASADMGSSGNSDWLFDSSSGGDSDGGSGSLSSMNGDCAPIARLSCGERPGARRN